MRERIRRLTFDLLQRFGHIETALELRYRFNSRRRRIGDSVALRMAPQRIRQEARAEGTGLAVHRTDGTRPLVVVFRRRDDPSIVAVANSNSRIVEECLDRGGIPTRAIPISSVNRARLAVLDDDHDRVIQALRRYGPSTLYLYIDDRTIPRGRRLHHIASAGKRFDRAIADARIVRVFEFRADALANDVSGDLYGCEIEFWCDAAEAEDDGGEAFGSDGGDLVRAHRANLESTLLPRTEFSHRSTRSDLDLLPLIEDVTFDVDVVYTWVDGDDPDWLSRREAALGGSPSDHIHEEAASDARYTSFDELRYSLRSLERFADFVRHVYLVTDAQRPVWLVDDHPRLSVVDHRQIFDDHSCLPTFNSHSIESRLHHIPGLSEHYVYMNDDFLFGRRVVASNFFFGNGIAKFFPSAAMVPSGAIDIHTKPVDMAAMNGRDLVEREFSRRVIRKMRHAPYPQLRTVQLDIERRFPAEVARTTASRVRSQTDLSLASFLHHHVAHATGRALPATIRNEYVDLGRPDLERKLARLASTQTFDTLCLNDTDSLAVSRATKQRIVQSFLETYLPEASSFER